MWDYPISLAKRIRVCEVSNTREPELCMLTACIIATCGGGGISPTFGAGLWVMDYVLQGALAGVDRLYFHQGTIGNCVSEM